MKKPFIFISWSKPLSKEVAVVLKKLLGRTFELDEDEIFVSSQNITGNGEGWFNEIIDKASSSTIFILCITKESLFSPWLHFETGIGVCRKTHPSKVIPFLFDISYHELNGNLGMYSHHQMVHSEDSGHDRFSDLLTQLLFYVNTFLSENRQKLLKKQVSVSINLEILKMKISPTSIIA